MSGGVLEFPEALATVLAQAEGLGAVRAVESVSLQEAEGRVLAEAVVADRDQPPFDRATRDGFALRAEDAAGELRVVGQIRAGQRWQGAPLAQGEALEVMTGSPLPEGADAVVMVEHVEQEGSSLRLQAGRTLRAGENVVPRGAEARAGARLLPVGRRLGAAEIAVAASCGAGRLAVFARPKVAIVATGDELVELSAGGEPGTVPGDAQIYNSNSYALAALVRAEGGVAGRLPVARDSFAELSERMESAKVAELLLLSGGVSMGKYDLVEQVLAEMGAEFFFTGALIQPGRPVVFGRLPTFAPARPWLWFFGLPGNPVSTQVCFALFVAPLLRAMAGRTEIAPSFVEARLAEAVKGGARVTRFLPAELAGAWDSVTVKVVGWQGSGDLAANARGNAYCVLPAGVESFPAGEPVRVLLR